MHLRQNQKSQETSSKTFKNKMRPKQHLDIKKDASVSVHTVERNIVSVTMQVLNVLICVSVRTVIIKIIIRNKIIALINTMIKSQIKFDKKIENVKENSLN